MMRIATLTLSSFLFMGCQSLKPFSEYSQVSAATYDDVKWVSAFNQKGEFLSLYKDIERADFEFHLNGEENLLSQRKEGVDFLLPKRRANSSSNKLFYDAFIVVQFHKVAQLAQVDEKVSRVNAYFFSSGAKRVLITGLRGSGVSIYSDKISKSNNRQ